MQALDVKATKGVGNDQTCNPNVQMRLKPAKAENTVLGFKGR